MSCLFCCCYRKQEDPAADKNAEEKVIEEPHELPRAEYENFCEDLEPKTNKETGDHISMRSRTSVDRDIQQPRRPSQVHAAVKPKDEVQDARTAKNSSGENATETTSKRTKKETSRKGGRKRNADSGSESDVSQDFPIDVTLVDLEAKIKLDECDSFDSELRADAAGRTSDSGARPYLLYGTDPQEDECSRQASTKDLMLMGLRKERDDFLKRRAGLTEAVLSRINFKRGRPPCSDPLQLDPELCDIARQVWHDRVNVRDGFVIVPRCVCFPRGRDASGLQRYGCLTYYTPRTERLDNLADAMVYFWCHEGKANSRRGVSIGNTFRGNLVVDFPAAEGETYVRAGSKMLAPFEKYRKDFAPQVLSGKCTKVGLHMDMARDTSDPACNIICVVAVFDYVACAFGRVMDSPF